MWPIWPERGVKPLAARGRRAHDDPMGGEPLTVVFQRWTELSDQQGHLQRGCLFVPCPEPLPEPFAELAVVIVAPDGQQVSLTGRVVQIAPGAGVAVACDDLAAVEHFLAPLFESAKAQADDADGSAALSQWGEPAAAPAEADEGDEATLHDRIRGMSSSEKMRLARSGDRPTRQLLVRDPNKTIQLHIIQNKRITIDEIRYLAGFRQANPEVLARIGETREWLQHTAVLTALVGNPKTPSRVAIRLLRSVSKSELRRIAKSPHAPRAVAIAARKMLADS